MIDRRTALLLIALGVATQAHAGNPKDIPSLPPWSFPPAPEKKSPAVLPLDTAIPKTPAVIPLDSTTPKTPAILPLDSTTPKTPAILPPLPDLDKTPAILPPDPIKGKVPPVIPLSPAEPETAASPSPAPSPSGSTAASTPPPAAPASNELPQFPAQLPSQLPSQIPSQIPSQLPTQFPSQFPAQMPTQFPTQFPTQLPSQLPSQLPVGQWPLTAAATAPGSTPVSATGASAPAALPALPAVSTVPAMPAMPAAPALPALPVSTPAVAPAVSLTMPPSPDMHTAFQGFAMNERAYELVNMFIPTPSGSARGQRGTFSLGADSFTLWNYQVSGPYLIRSQPSPYAAARTGELAAWSGARTSPDVRVWQVYADIYPATAPAWHRSGGTYYPRKAGVLWARIIQKMDTNVYIQAPGPQTAIIDGFASFWSARYRLLASGAFSVGQPAAPASTSPSAPNTDDLNRSN